MTKLKRNAGQVQVQGHMYRTTILRWTSKSSDLRIVCVSESSCILHHPTSGCALALVPFFFSSSFSHPLPRCQDQTRPAIRRYHAALLFPFPFLFRSTTPLSLLPPCDDGNPCEARPLGAEVCRVECVRLICCRGTATSPVQWSRENAVGKSMVKKPIGTCYLVLTATTAKPRYRTRSCPAAVASESSRCWRSSSTARLVCV
jgi:hypothetical protein